MQFEPTFSLGNVITIVTLVLLVGGHLLATSAMISKFMGQSETDRSNLHKKVDDLEKKCNDCYLHDKVKELEKEKIRMNTEQVELRAKLPGQLEAIWTELKAIRGMMADRRKTSRENLQG